ncbi:NAD(P)-dependent oxidoreductase [Lactobacillus delbrueckii subsp. bulgaricus]|uniref:NAD-dependent epimerase/dehydratase family protein n=2 Tax=Lactobacillus delbrueckii TaxID=1584 RepID=UPI00159492F1|nr:NAD-dependent epimerase/dehydratase family protein [Lactobacillus delbrueckii]NVH28588.1 NAD(P)-dependent oxidoreductase [Lactobacillus delbrueckii subsp. bulgaricus]NWO31337.1 NAD(P)-dependent oxidoreductase [Lactobacillus delbrueckii subsp. bulgaricus]
MTKAVLLCGNGYIGRATNESWMKADPETEFYVISRSGRNELTDKRIHNLRADVSDYEEVKAVLPEDFDYIVDFVGAPENDPEKFKPINVMPAKVMKRLAEEYKAKKMGFIAGSLGPKSFVQGKADLVKFLQDSSVPLEYVSPTLVYGNGRKDDMTRWLPLLKFFGIFSKKIKPVEVNNVADELVRKMLA